MNIPQLLNQPLDAAKLLESLSESGIEITATDDGQRLSCKSARVGGITSQIKAAIAEHKAEIIAILAARSRPAPLSTEPAPTPPEPFRPAPAPPPVHHARRRQPAPATPVAWPAAIADWAMLLAADDLPPAPFQFGGRWCVVNDPGRFLRSLRADIRQGPRGPRAATGAIQADLWTLKALLVGIASSATGSANMPQAVAA